MKHANVLVWESVPGANEIVPVRFPLVTSIVAPTRSGGIGTTGGSSTPFRVTGKMTVSPTGSVTLPVRDGGDGNPGDDDLLHAATITSAAMLTSQPRVIMISSAFRKKALTPPRVRRRFDPVS